MKSEIFDSATGTFSDSVDVPFEGHAGTAVQLGPNRIGIIGLGSFIYSSTSTLLSSEVRLVFIFKGLLQAESVHNNIYFEI